MKSPTRITLSILIGMALGISHAQAPLTLQEAVKTAILKNPEVLVKFHNFEASQQELRAAQGGFLPRIELEAASGTSTTDKPWLTAPNTYANPRSSLQLRQTLFDGFATRQELRRLSHAQQAAFFDLQAISNAIGLEAARAYLDVMRYRTLVELAGDNFGFHQEIYQRIDEKVKAGVGRRVDLEQTAGRLALSESNWLIEVSNLHDATARFQRLIGEPPAENLTKAEPMDEFLPIGTDFLKDAVVSNPEFLSAVATIRAYRADLGNKRAPLMPTVELRARQAVESNQSGTMGGYRDSTVEVVMNFNLFRGGSDLTRSKQYASKLNAALELRDKACRDVWQTLQIAFNDSVRLSAQLKLLSQHELSTGKARRAYQQQFDIGQRSLLDLLDTENEYYQSRRALNNAEFDLQLAEIRVLATSGTLLKALKLRPLADEAPEAGGGIDAGDDALECSTRLVPNKTLDRASLVNRPRLTPYISSDTATPTPAGQDANFLPAPGAMGNTPVLPLPTPQPTPPSAPAPAPVPLTPRAPEPNPTGPSSLTPSTPALPPTQKLAPDSEN